MQQNVNTSTQASKANFTCEMSGYILPDKDLLWIRNSGSPIKNSEKYTISFKNGSHSTAQNGGRRQSPSRKSTLVIHNPTKNEAGEYFCSLRGTQQFIKLLLNVGGDNTGKSTRLIQKVPMYV